MTNSCDYKETTADRVVKRKPVAINQIINMKLKVTGNYWEKITDDETMN